MLILSRRVGETLCVGDDMTITVLAIKGNKMRIGVNAPDSVSVDREEVRERKRREVDVSRPYPGSDIGCRDGMT